MHFKNFALGFVSEEDQLLCAKIVVFLDSLIKMISWVRCSNEDVEIPKILDCHVISRFISLNIPELKFVDGHFYGLCPEGDAFMIYTCAHSWLITPSRDTILDAYPVDLVAFGTVIALPLNIPEEAKKSASFGAAKYRECEMNPKWWSKEETENGVRELDEFCKIWFPKFNAAHPE